MMTKSVCIIGAGPSGLVAAKTLLYNAPKDAFKVTIYDAQKRIGGLWPLSKDDNGGMVHPLMTTNQSRNTMHFSDFAWEDTDPQLPKAWQVGRYLEKYLRRYPGAEIKLGHRVVATDLLGDKRWEVKVKAGEGGDEQTSVFDYLLVATGYFGRPAVPDFIKGDESIPVMHSSKYRKIEDFLGTEDKTESSTATTTSTTTTATSKPKGSKILVVGGQMSGVEIAGTIASHLSSVCHSPEPGSIAKPERYSVHHLIQQPAWVFPLLVNPATNNDNIPFVPVDVAAYSLTKRGETTQQNFQGHISVESARSTSDLFTNWFGGDQSKISESIAIKGEDRSKPQYLAMSDLYTGFVRSGDIKVTKAKLASLDSDNNIATLTEYADGTESKMEDIAAVVLATGFDAGPCLSFLPASVLETLHYSPHHRDLALALGFHSTQHTDLPTLGFVGFYRSPYWGIMEMQARFLTGLWFANIQGGYPLRLLRAFEKNEEHVADILKLRTDPRRSQFPMGDYVYIMYEMAEAVGTRMIPLEDPETLTIPPSPSVYTTANTDLSNKNNQEEENESRKHPDLAQGQEEIQADNSTDIPSLNVLVPSRFLSLYTDASAREENAIARGQVLEVATLSKLGNRFVPRAVFRSLLGEWKLERRLESRLDTYPSGDFAGTAKFFVRAATNEGRICLGSDVKANIPTSDQEKEENAAGKSQKGDLEYEYLYVEQGLFKTDNDMVFQASRRYIWRYDEEKECMSVWFARTDGDGDRAAADYLFHEVEFLPFSPVASNTGDLSSPLSTAGVPSVAAGPGPEVASIPASELSSSAASGWRAKAGHLCIEDFYGVEYFFKFRAFDLEKWTVGYEVKGPRKNYTIRGLYTRKG